VCPLLLKKSMKELRTCTGRVRWVRLLFLHIDARRENCGACEVHEGDVDTKVPRRFRTAPCGMNPRGGGLVIERGAHLLAGPLFLEFGQLSHCRPASRGDMDQNTQAGEAAVKERRRGSLSLDLITI
jgi:hypothetical protein